MGQIDVRRAVPADAGTVLELVKKLARYEQLEHEVTADAIAFSKILQPESRVEVLLAMEQTRAVGFALFFENFSTFLGKPGLYLEDLFVEPDRRRQGIGKALFREMLRIARERDYGRFEWSVLDWNKTAIQFYTEYFDAKLLVDWRICRIVL